MQKKMYEKSVAELQTAKAANKKLMPFYAKLMQVNVCVWGVCVCVIGGVVKSIFFFLLDAKRACKLLELCP